MNRKSRRRDASLQKKATRKQQALVPIAKGPTAAEIRRADIAKPFEHVETDVLRFAREQLARRIQKIDQLSEHDRAAVLKAGDDAKYTARRLASVQRQAEVNGLAAVVTFCIEAGVKPTQLSHLVHLLGKIRVLEATGYVDPTFRLIPLGYDKGKPATSISAARQIGRGDIAGAVFALRGTGLTARAAAEAVARLCPSASRLIRKAPGPSAASNVERIEDIFEQTDLAHRKQTQADAEHNAALQKATEAIDRDSTASEAERKLRLETTWRFYLRKENEVPYNVVIYRQRRKEVEDLMQECASDPGKRDTELNDLARVFCRAAELSLAAVIDDVAIIGDAD